MQAAIPLVGNVKVILRQILDPGRTGNQLRCMAGAAHRLPPRGAEPPLPPSGGLCVPRDRPAEAGRPAGRRRGGVCGCGAEPDLHLQVLPQKNGRLLTSGGLGTMGYALPAAVGAKVARPDRQTIVVCGDGSFQMAMNELAAVRAGGLNLKIVLFRNHTLGLVHQIQSSRPLPAGPSVWRWTAPRTLRPLPPRTGSPASRWGTRITWTRRWTVFWAHRAAVC